MKSEAAMDFSLLRRTVIQFWPEFAWAGVFSFVANLMLLAPTLYMLQVFDRVMLSQNEFTLMALTLITVFFFVIMAFSEWVRARLLVRAGVKFDLALNRRLFDVSFSANLARQAGNPSQPFTDLTAIRQFLTGNGLFTLFDMPWAPIYLAVLFMMHPVLGWVSIGFALLLLVMAWLGHRVSSKPLAKAQESSLGANTFLNAKLRNAEAVHAMGMREAIRGRWFSLHDRAGQDQSDAASAGQRVQSVTKAMQLAQQSLILAAGAILAIQGEITAGAMIASNALMSNALRPLSVLMSTWKQFVDGHRALLRLESVLEQHPPTIGAHEARAVRGHVDIKNLVARAPGRKKPILEGISLQVEPGQIVAVVGPSGAGKSTLMRCILGIWPGVEGVVKLDGVDLARWDRDALGSHLGYLPQDIELFDGSLADNIARFGKVDSEAVIRAATRAQIHELILRLPRGYDSAMGEAGAAFSGGQRQRVGLARALFGEPKLVVLDEPNANLDDAGTQALVRALQDLKAAGATVFMVVHHAALTTVADQVVQMKDGRIVDVANASNGRNAA